MDKNTKKVYNFLYQSKKNGSNYCFLGLKSVGVKNWNHISSYNEKYDLLKGTGIKENILIQIINEETNINKSFQIKNGLMIGLTDKGLEDYKYYIKPWYKKLLNIKNGWQNNLLLFIIITLLIGLIGWGANKIYSNYENNKILKEKFISDYDELTKKLIPYVQVFSCSKLPIENDIIRKDFIEKNDKVDYIILDLKKNYKKINDDKSLTNFPILLDKYIIEVKAFECKDLLNKKKELDNVYNRIIE